LPPGIVNSLAKKAAVSEKAKETSAANRYNVKSWKVVSEMAKSNRQVYKIPQPKVPKALQLEQSSKPVAPVLPERNQLCFGVFGACLVVGLTLDAFLVYYLAHNALVAYGEHPINWLQAILYTVFVAMALSLVRGVVWGSFVLSAALAGRTQSFTAQMQICQWARKLHLFLPGGSSWATQAIIQRMIAKEDYKDAIALGSAEYETLAKKNPKDQSLANLGSCIAFSYQMQNEHHRSIEWNEKAIQSFEQIFESIAKSGGIKKYAGQSVVETLQIQYAQVLVGLGSSYLAVQNRMKAKEHLKNALVQARKAPDSPQKRDVIRACEEYLRQLKHF
jgi:tetratricopeptide (TPR) repeat protein